MNTEQRPASLARRVLAMTRDNPSRMLVKALIALAVAFLIATIVVLEAGKRGAVALGSGLASLAPWSTQLAAGSIVTFGSDTVALLHSRVAMEMAKHPGDSLRVFRGEWQHRHDSLVAAVDTSSLIVLVTDGSPTRAALLQILPDKRISERIVGELWLEKPYKRLLVVDGN